MKTLLAIAFFAAVGFGTLFLEHRNDAARKRRAGERDAIKAKRRQDVQ